MELHHRSDYLPNSYYFPFLWTYPFNYLPSLKRKLQRSRVESMQDVLLTVSDLYFCYKVAKAARRALATLATRNLHVVGRFNSPPSLPLPDSLRLHGLPVRRWRGSHTVAQVSEKSSSHLGVSGTNVREKMQERQVAAIFTCDEDNFRETIIILVCRVFITYSRAWINRVRLPILFVVR